MAKIEVEISYVDIENEQGILLPSVQANCTKCGHITESFGTSERSVKRCLVLLKEECPESSNNFYVCDEA